MEIFRALGSLAEAPSPELQRIAHLLELGPLPSEDEATDLFLFQLFPYASVYLGADGQLGGEARDRVAGFWRALGLRPPEEPDHLAALLAFYSELREREASVGDRQERRRWRHARTALLYEHLLSWLPLYFAKLADLDPPFYRGWAELAQRALFEEAAALGPCQTLPLHLRAAPPLADPRREGGDEFLGGLLSPVRSGIILARADLTRLARDLLLARRVGLRRLVLEALLEQDAAGVLSWIASEAGRWAGRHAVLPATLGPIGEFWTRRARRCRDLLQALSTDP